MPIAVIGILPHPALAFVMADARAAGGVEFALVVAGLILPTLALIAYSGVRHAEAASILPERELAIMRQMPMFAPLPLTALEHLARSLEPVSFATGERVITQGEAGDCYYLIESGTVEIALLSDRRRTATVQVLSQLEGFRLPRDAFLESVTGSPHSVLAADELVARRLAELGH